MILRKRSDGMDVYISKQDMLNAVEKLDIIPSVDGMGIPTEFMI